MKIRSNFMLRLASFLFICVIASTVVLSGLLARYTSSGAGHDEARVIRFGNLEIKEEGDFSLHGDHNDFIIVPGTEVKKDINISFTGSEAKTYLFVKLNLYNPWWKPYTMDKTDPLYMKKFVASQDSVDVMSWSVADGWNYIDGSSYVYYKEIEPNSGTVSYDFIADTVPGGNTGKIVFSEDVTDSYMKEHFGEIGSVKYKISINVTAYVVQANGFDSVEDAWNSVSIK